jgi:hypothetical protein
MERSRACFSLFWGLRFERMTLRQSNHGFDRTLTLVSTRREDDFDHDPVPEPEPIPPSTESCTHRVLLWLSTAC